MPSREVRLEELLGKVVRTAAGRAVGRIEDLRAEPEGEEYVVREVILGDLGWRARLYSMAAQLPTFRALGLGGHYRTRAIPWQWLDITDPEQPRFRGEEGGEGGEGGKAGKGRKGGEGGEGGKNRTR